VIWHNGCALAL